MICRAKYFPELEVKLTFNKEFCRPGRHIMKRICTNYFYIYFRELRSKKRKIRIAVGVLTSGKTKKMGKTKKIANHGHVETAYIIYGLLAGEFPAVKVDMVRPDVYMYFIG